MPRTPAVVIIDESKTGGEENREIEKELFRSENFTARPLYRLISFAKRSLTAAD